MRDDGTRQPARIGLIGFGRIGRRLARFMAQTPAQTHLVAILSRSPAHFPAHMPEAENGVRLCETLEDFLATSPDIVVECASAQALAMCGADILKCGSDLIPLSLAALADPLFENALMAAAEAGPGRLEIPAGAMGSIDFLAAARMDALHSVVFRAAYPAARWKGTPAEKMVDLSSLANAHTFLRSSVREAVTLFPRHINVSVGVALAGLGLDRTQAELVADPALMQATFEVIAEAGPGSATLFIGGRDALLGSDPVDYTTFSVLRLLRRRKVAVAI